jgi:hypothetical protein
LKRINGSHSLPILRATIAERMRVWSLGAEVGHQVETENLPFESVSTDGKSILFFGGNCG